MIEFVCRICGCSSYSGWPGSEYFCCDQCGVIFNDPTSFSLSFIKRNFEIVDKEFLKHDEHNELPDFLPNRATSKSAGYDFYSPEEFIINPGQDYKLWTDIKVCMADDEFLFIDNRSSIANKHDVIIKNIIPIIDADYYNNPDTGGNIQIRFKNNGNQPFKFYKNDKIAQGIFMKYLLTNNDVPRSDIRTGGIGSTGR